MHIPVLQKEVLQYLDPKPNENFIDGTLGYGGHTISILEKTGPGGKVLGIEKDAEMIKNVSGRKEIKNFKNRLILENNSFVNLKEIVEKNKFKSVSGILLDLGMSSWHVDSSKKGFSFLKNEPLDMRYSELNPLTAEKILNYWSQQELEKIIKEYGEERFSQSISRKIADARKIKKIETTGQLVDIIRQGISSSAAHQKIHFATRTFQALRIAVNDELNSITRVLPQALEILNKGGKLAVISFHSLEDRIVKNFNKDSNQKQLATILTKKPIIATLEEVKENPRSRSAKLRVISKI